MREIITLRATGILALAAALSSAALAEGSDRADRQLRVFESAFNAMLVDSPNILVQSHEPATANYVSGHGLTVAFKTSLVSDHDGDHWWRWGRDRSDRWRDDNLDRQAKLYDRGKDEIVETVVTFGEVLTALNDSDWIEITAKLRDATYFRENDLRRLSLRVKVSDLRAYYDGRIGETELANRMELKES